MASDDIQSQLPEGEAVLIDTRQHWVAAIRYALKPFLLLGAVVLLALLNQWLDLGDDSFLGIINTIIHWVLVIMIIVAVIWLPIDLAQWYSRRYVLTNRRAIRYSGVLRKQTYGSSLEKINDIGVHESVLGRVLGYSDLTFFTASDTVNEGWSQLRDGLQFKKAAYEAKEGLRVRKPLMALPDDLVVKGGTNEASRRADGKMQDGAGDDRSSDEVGAASGDGESAMVTAVPAHASPIPEPVGPITAEPVAAPALVVEPESSADDGTSKAGTEADAEPASQSTKIEALSDVDPGSPEADASAAEGSDPDAPSPTSGDDKST